MYLENILNNDIDNHILPFFWQHGEDETTLRKYMEVIDNSNIQVVCVESRPHPDFAGELWWRDLNIIFDEANPGTIEFEQYPKYQKSLCIKAFLMPKPTFLNLANLQFEIDVHTK